MEGVVFTAFPEGGHEPVVVETVREIKEKR